MVVDYCNKVSPVDMTTSMDVSLHHHYLLGDELLCYYSCYYNCYY